MEQSTYSVCCSKKIGEAVGKILNENLSVKAMLHAAYKPEEGLKECLETSGDSIIIEVCLVH